jgi:hypothetical protein
MKKRLPVGGLFFVVCRSRAVISVVEDEVATALTDGDP